MLHVVSSGSNSRALSLRRQSTRHAWTTELGALAGDILLRLRLATNVERNNSGEARPPVPLNNVLQETREGFSCSCQQTRTGRRRPPAQRDHRGMSPSVLACPFLSICLQVGDRQIASTFPPLKPFLQCLLLIRWLPVQVRAGPQSRTTAPRRKLGSRFRFVAALARRRPRACARRYGRLLRPTIRPSDGPAAAQASRQT